MSLKKAFAKAAAGLTLVVSTAAAAFAYPATSTTPLNVRSGPGPSFGVVGVIQPGQVVDVQGCQGSWCQVGNGWASARYLAEVETTTRTRVRPRANVGVSIGIGNTFGIGPGWYDDGYYGFRSRDDFFDYHDDPNFRVSFGNPNFRFSIGTGSSRRFYQPFDYYRDDDCFRGPGGRIYCTVD